MRLRRIRLPSAAFLAAQNAPPPACCLRYAGGLLLGTVTSAIIDMYTGKLHRFGRAGESGTHRK